jgi:hypothetical protein
MDDNGIGFSMLTITAFFLFAVFFASEFYRLRRRITGAIREIRTLEGDPTGLMGAHLQVVTYEDVEITAFVSGCQMCASPVAIGDMVSLVPGPHGYIIKSPWIAKRRHGACPKGVAS